MATGVPEEAATSDKASLPQVTTAEVVTESEAVTTPMATGVPEEAATSDKASLPQVTTAEVVTESEAVTTPMATGVPEEAATSDKASLPQVTTAEVVTESEAVTTPMATGVPTIFAQTGTGPNESNVVPLRRPSSISIPMTATPPSASRAPVTTAPVTTAPVTTAPVTTAPVTTAPVTTAPVTTAPVTTAPPVVTHSFRVCQPTTLDASKPAWSFSEAEGKPKSEPAPLPAPEPKTEVIQKEAEAAVTKDAIAWFAAHANLYTLARVLLYCAIIATSRQPVDDFFQTLNVFGTASLNSFFALAVTITMDLIAMNLFGRAIRAVFGKTHRLELTLAYGLPALAIIGANVLLTHRNIETKANVQTNAKLEATYEEDLAVARAAKKLADAEYASAEGAFFAKKWKGSTDPEACEAGKTACAGPYSTSAQPEQANFIAKKRAKDIAEKDVAKLEAKRPVLTDSTSAAGADQKLWVYLVLWAGILMSYVYEPRKIKLGRTSQVAG
jgi:hypothetical protein